jgi:hypothetical protein
MFESVTSRSFPLIYVDNGWNYVFDISGVQLARDPAQQAFYTVSTTNRDYTSTGILPMRQLDVER